MNLKAQILVVLIGLLLVVPVFATIPLSPSNMIINTNGTLTDVFGNPETLNLTGLNVTTLNVAVFNNTVGYVQEYRLLVENGTAFPSTVSDGYIFYRTDYHKLTLYSNGAWVNCSTVDQNTYLLANGTQALTGNWNLGGSYGVYGATWLNSTSINGNNYYLGSSQLGFVDKLLDG